MKRLSAILFLFLLAATCFCETAEKKVINSWRILEGVLSLEPCEANDKILTGFVEVINEYKNSEIYKFSLTQKTNDVFYINNIEDSAKKAILYNRNNDYESYSKEIRLLNSNMVGFILVIENALEESSYLLALMMILFSVFVVFVFFLILKLRQVRLKSKTARNDSIIALQAQENECNRIAHELHDSVVQDIRAMQLYKSELEKHMTVDADSKAKDAFSKIDILSERSLNNIRSIIKNLVPPVFDNIEFKSLIANLCKETTDIFKIKCVFSVIDNEDEANDLLEQLPKETKLYLYRIIQEAVNNAVKYASPSEIHVHIREVPTKRRIIIFIDDNGCGIEATKGNTVSTKLGIKGMKMRASLMNAKITIDSSAETGTSVRVELPV